MKQEQERLNETQNHENLKALLTKIETLKGQIAPFLGLTSGDYLKNQKEKKEQMASLNASRLQMLGEFSELQIGLSFSFFENHQNLMQQIGEAVRGERDALKMLVETQRELSRLKDKISEGPRSSAAASDDAEEFVDRNAASAEQALLVSHLDSSFALVLSVSGCRGAQPLQSRETKQHPFCTFNFFTRC